MIARLTAALLPSWLLIGSSHGLIHESSDLIQAWWCKILGLFGSDYYEVEGTFLITDWLGHFLIRAAGIVGLHPALSDR